MNHLSEEQLILHYYGEEGDALSVDLHLEECGQCRALFASLQRVLNVMDGLPVPDRPADYGEQVWQRIAHLLPADRRAWWAWPAPWRCATTTAVCAGMMLAAFFAGRFYPPAHSPQSVATTDSQAGERVLLAAVGDYLERSQMVLTELANANPKNSLDISNEQERAGDLVTETRLRSENAERNG